MSNLAAGTIIVDLGQKPAKLIENLKKGRGRLADEIQDMIDELTRAKEIPEGSTAVPVIVVVKEKAKAAF